MHYDREKLGAYLASKYPDKYGPFSPEIQLLAVEGPNGEVLAEIVKWMEGSPFPDPAEVDAMQPSQKDTIDTCEQAIKDATTIAGLRSALLRLVKVLKGQ